MVPLKKKILNGLNGRLARLIHGTCHAGLQIHSNLSLLRGVPSLLHSVVNRKVKLFCQSAMSKTQRLLITQKISDGLFIIGKLIKEHVLPRSFDEALMQQQVSGSNCSFFFRLKKEGLFYVAEDYRRGKRNSSCVKYMSEGNEVLFGSIKVFVKVTDCDCVKVCQHPGTFHVLIQRFHWDYPFMTSEPNVTIRSVLRCVILLIMYRYKTYKWFALRCVSKMLCISLCLLICLN